MICAAPRNLPGEHERYSFAESTGSNFLTLFFLDLIIHFYRNLSRGESHDFDLFLLKRMKFFQNSGAETQKRSRKKEKEKKERQPFDALLI